MSHWKRTLPIIVAAAALIPGCTRDSSVSGLPPESSNSSEDWPLPGKDLSNSRAATESTIRAGSISRLKVAWSTSIPGESQYGNLATTPIVVGESVFVQDLMSNVRAIDRRTGKVRWVQKFERPQIGPNGVAVGWGKVFAGTGGTDISAMDLSSGKVLWTRKLPSSGTESIGIQPQVFNGKVLVSTVPVSPDKGGYLGGGQGVIFALNQQRGDIDWSFNTVAGKSLWGNEKINSGGGAWYPPAIDPKSNTVYWGTGNPGPFPGTPEFPNGSSRPGENLYTNSVVALDLDGGALTWYRQASPHDLFDHDLMLTAIANLEDGRRVLIGTGKAGRVIGHDPTIGKVIWDTKVGIHRNDELTNLDGPTEVAPGVAGGVLTPLATANGEVYVAVINSPTTYSPNETAVQPPELGAMPGEIVALDARSGSILWTTKLAGDPLGGALVVGDLVFTSTVDGTLYGLARSSGKIIWKYVASGGTNGWPAHAHDTIYWPIGIGPNPMLLAFSLDGIIRK